MSRYKQTYILTTELIQSFEALKYAANTLKHVVIEVDHQQYKIKVMTSTGLFSYGEIVHMNLIKTKDYLKLEIESENGDAGFIDFNINKRNVNKVYRYFNRYLERKNGGINV